MASPSNKIEKLKVKEKSSLLYKIQEKHSEHNRVSKCALLIGAGCSFPILPLGGGLIKLCQQLSYVREIHPIEAAKLISDFFKNADFLVLENFINAQNTSKKTFEEYVIEKELILKELINNDKDIYLKRIPVNISNPSWKDFESLVINDARYSFWLDLYSNSPKERQRFIEALIDNKSPNGAYIILALLIEMGYFHNILTTNFDDFINDALLYYTSTRPKFYADDELSQYISVYSGKPNIIKLHGDYRYANIKNTADETLRLSIKMEEKLKELLQNFDLIVIGYNGADYSIMNVLQQAKSPNCELLWCGKDETDVHWRVANLINSTDNSWFVKTHSFDDIIKDFYINFIQSPPDLVTKAKQRQDEIKDFVLEYSQVLQNDESVSDEEKIDLKNKDVIWNLYTKALNEQNNLEKIKICNEILTKDEKYSKAHNLIGVANFALKKYEEAVVNFTNAIELEYTDPVFHSNRGHAHKFLNNHKNAIIDLTEAIKLDSKHFRAYGLRGDVYIALKDYENALSDYNEAIQLDGNDAVALNNRGYILLQIKNYENAILDFRKAIELNNTIANPHKSLGEIFFQKEQFKESLEELNKAIELKSDYLDAYELRSQVHRQLKNKDKAEEDEKIVANLKSKVTN